MKMFGWHLKVEELVPTGKFRGIGEKVGQTGKTSGVVPFIRVMDSLTAISQGSLRRGSAACYLPIWHLKLKNL